MKQYIKNHPLAAVQNALQEANISFEIGNDEIFSRDFEGFLQKFCGKNEYSYPLWELLDDDKCVVFQKEFAWDLFDEILVDKKINLFFDPHDSPQNIISLSNGALLKQVLENSYGFTFYLSDETQSFALVWDDDHGLLYAAGEAIIWLYDYAQKISEGVISSVDGKNPFPFEKMKRLIAEQKR